jgi:hypothetical protein
VLRFGKAHSIKQTCTQKPKEKPMLYKLYQYLKIRGIAAQLNKDLKIYQDDLQKTKELLNEANRRTDTVRNTTRSTVKVSPGHARL